MDSMDAKPKRGFWQIHLSTAAVLMIAASGLLFVNVCPQPVVIHDFPGGIPPLYGFGIDIHSHSYGWPFPCAMQHHLNSSEIVFADFSKPCRLEWLSFAGGYRGLIIDIVVCGLMLFGFAIVLEFSARRREARKQ